MIDDYHDRASELAERGVRANAVIVSSMKTPVRDEQIALGLLDEGIISRNSYREDYHGRCGGQGGSVCLPDDASYVTGSSLVADGRLTSAAIGDAVVGAVLDEFLRDCPEVPGVVVYGICPDGSGAGYAAGIADPRTGRR